MKSRMGIVGGNRSMFSVYMDMLASMGGSFKAFVSESREEPKPEREWAAKKILRSASPLSDRRHIRDSRGVVRRRVPKRDKSISARQWKKRVKADRAVARMAQLLREEKAA